MWRNCEAICELNFTELLKRFQRNTSPQLMTTTLGWCHENNDHRFKEYSKLRPLFPSELLRPFYQGLR